MKTKTTAQSERRPPAKFNGHIKPTGEPFHYFDIRSILGTPVFANSEAHIGLQPVDVAVSAVRRAMVGTFRKGWRRIGSILVRAPGDETESVRIIQIGRDKAHWVPQPLYHRVLLALRKEALPSLPPEDW